jgi:hypothetical protein
MIINIKNSFLGLKINYILGRIHFDDFFYFIFLVRTKLAIKDLSFYSSHFLYFLIVL